MCKSFRHRTESDLVPFLFAANENIVLQQRELMLLQFLYP